MGKRVILIQFSLLELDQLSSDRPVNLIILVLIIRALKEDGYRVILINSNPATIMTDPDLADATYIEPLTKEYLEFGI